METGYETQWGFTTQYAPNSIYGQLEQMARLLQGRSTNDEPELFGANDGNLLEHRRYNFANRKMFLEPAVRSTMSAMSRVMGTYIPDRASVLEAGAGRGYFTQGCIYPFVRDRGGTFVSTELGTRADHQAFAAVSDPELNQSCLDNIDLRTLSENGLSQTFQAVIATGVFDVVPPAHMAQITQQLREVLTESGVVIHMLDIGAGAGPMRGPDAVLKQAYVDSLKSKGVPLDGRSIKPNIPLAARLEKDARQYAIPGLTKEDRGLKLAGAYQLVETVFSNAAAMAMQTLQQRGVDIRPYQTVSIAQLMEVAHKQSLSITYNLQEMTKAATVKRGRVDIGFPLEALYVFMIDLLGASQSDGNAFDQFLMLAVFNEVSHLINNTYLKHSFAKGGFDLIGEGFLFGDEVEVPASPDPIHIDNLAGVKVIHATRKPIPSVTSGIHYLTWRKGE